MSRWFSLLVVVIIMLLFSAAWFVFVYNKIGIVLSPYVITTWGFAFAAWVVIIWAVYWIAFLVGLIPHDKRI